MTNPFNFTLEALEDERRYVAKELHDGVAQTTLQLGLQISICRKLLERGKIDTLANDLAQLEKHAQRASFQIREMIADMRPPKVDPTADLNQHLQFAIDLHRERGGPPITYRMDIDPSSLALSPQHKLAITRIVQESLLNIRKHAKATNAWVYAAGNENALWVSIADDGSGFDLGEAENRATDQGGAGLANMRLRAQAIGGTLTIAKGPNGQGIKITVTWTK